MTIMIPAWRQGELQPVEKLLAHQLGLRHLAISVFVMRGDMILLQRRALSKYHTPGLWANTCCTHPAWGEDASACAERRLKEELGIVNLPLVHRAQVEYRADVGNGLIEHELVEVFTADVVGELQMNLNPDEVSEVRWSQIEDLMQDIERHPEAYTPWLKIYLRSHREAIMPSREIC